jgi:hypothetical protein
MEQNTETDLSSLSHPHIHQGYAFNMVKEILGDAPRETITQKSVDFHPKICLLEIMVGKKQKKNIQQDIPSSLVVAQAFGLLQEVIASHLDRNQSHNSLNDTKKSWLEGLIKNLRPKILCPTNHHNWHLRIVKIPTPQCSGILSNACTLTSIHAKQ